MTKILIGSIGTNNYRGATYEFETESPEYSVYFIHALAQKVKPDKVLFLLTDGAKEKHWEGRDGILYWFKGTSPAPELIPVTIPTGANQDEAWEIFKAIADHIPPKSEVYVDITNGLRNIPSLMLSALKYLQFAKEITISEVYYCAFESVDRDADKPTYSLALFSLLLDWANAVDMFTRTGNSTLLAELLERSPETTLHTLDLPELAKLLRHLSLSLELIRPEGVMKYSAELVSLLDTMKIDNLPTRLQPFGLLLDKLREDFRKFNLVEPRNPKNTKAFLEKKFDLVEWYLEHKNPSNAILLAREWFVSWYLFKYKNVRGQALFQFKQRDQTIIVRGKEKTIWKKVTNLRNDLAHCGMRMSPKPSDVLQEEITRVITEIKEFKY